ncbi:MAG: stage II sporulation protein M [Vicinamibacterales bacterium]
MSRRPRWQQLEALISSARSRRGSRLSAAELEDLGRLYRQATSDLAIARRDFPRDRVTRYLESLVSRAHPAVYRPEGSQLKAVGHFITAGYPRAFRASGRYIAAAFALFAVPFLFAFTLALADPTAARVVLPNSPFVEQVERGETWLEAGRSERAPMASFIATNNIQVSFFAFAGGALFGLGTAFVMVNNGLSIGAVAGLASNYALGDDLSAFVSPHGGIELTVIFIAGGAGLLIGDAMLRPGLLTRRQSLVRAGQRAIYLVFGCVPLLLIAGAFEGFVSPSGLPDIGKYLVGAFNLIWLYAWLLLAGHSSSTTLAA